MLATGIKGEIAASGAGRGGLGEGQGGEQQDGDREGDREEFIPPPPPDRTSAANARPARWAAVGRSAAWFTVVTLHQCCAFVIAVLGAQGSWARGLVLVTARYPRQARV